jgi:ribonuclease Z
MSGPDAVLRIIGPVGTSALVDALLQMLGADVGYRLAHHDDLHSPPRVEVTEVRPGAQLELGELSVLVGATDHRPVEPSLGFRVSVAQQSVVIAGDGVPCESLDDLVRGADAYVQTVVRDDLVRLVPVPRLHDILDYHSTVAQAADTARRAGVRVLVLTHYVPAPPVGEEHAWAASARECFDGEIVAGPDLTSVNLS